MQVSVLIQTDWSKLFNVNEIYGEECASQYKLLISDQRMDGDRPKLKITQLVEECQD